MKGNVVVGLLALVFFLFVSQAEATLLGNPSANLDQGQVSVGAEYAFVQKDTESAGEVDEGEAHRIVGTVSYGFHERIEAFAKVGAAKIDVESDDPSVTDFNGDFKPSFGGGIKATLLQGTVNEDSNWKIGMMGQYMRVESEDTLVVSGLSVDSELDINEWYAALGGSYTYKGFTPYGGAYLNFIDGEATASLFGLSASTEFEEEELFGVFVGVDWEVFENVTIRAEGRFIDQTTIGAGIYLAL